ncbi:MAG TPA: sugar phosphate isomerase/epimerase family protein [Terriglobia bacterium]|nr:sugar phosphate isomerase/epimerase family protein [Terriglobia bacterium]
MKTSLAAPVLILGSRVERAMPVTLPFKLGIITDEISEDVDEALDFISGHSLRYCELREMWQKNIMNLTRTELDRVKESIDRRHLQVSDIASPIFKYELPEMPAHPDQALEFHSTFTERDTPMLLNRCFEIAHFFGTEKIRIFSYWRAPHPEKAYPYVRDRLAKAAELARQNGIILMIENEYDTNVGTGKELGRILRDVNSPNLRANWDSANAAMMNEVPYPDGYREVEGLFPHLHVKDVKRDPQSGELSWAPVGSGFIDWRGQLKALQQAGYTGTMSIETHFRPSGNALAMVSASLDGLLKILHELAPA